MIRKRVCGMICALVLGFGLLAMPAHAAGGLDNFSQVHTYTRGEFKDVSEGAWYEVNVAAAYELGLMNGRGDSLFEPGGTVSLAEVATMAARVHSLYYRGHRDFETTGDVWYDTYIDYCVANGIIETAYDSYDRAATRAEFADVLSRALPSWELEAINDVAEGDIPDVSLSAGYAHGVYSLYRAGILTGSDEKGRFYPDSTIQRAEAATVLARMALPENRKVFAPFPVFEGQNKSVYIEQGETGGCVIACTAMMISNHRLMNGLSAVSYEEVKAANGGVYLNWGVFGQYGTAYELLYSSDYSYLSPEDKLALILEALAENPCGVMVHFSGVGSHAVLAVGYEDGQLIVNDPIPSEYGGEGLRLVDCRYLTDYVTCRHDQLGMLAYCDFISSAH